MCFIFKTINKYSFHFPVQGHVFLKYYCSDPKYKNEIMFTNDPPSKSSFAPPHIKSQIGALIDCANHSSLEIFVILYDARDGLAGVSAPPRGQSQETASATTCFCDGTAKAKIRYLSEGFHYPHARRGDQSASSPGVGERTFPPS